MRLIRISNIEDDYRGNHKAPCKHNGAPLYDLTMIYPDDIYSSNAVQYYGDRRPDDFITMNIIFSCRNRPEKMVSIYRAVPNLLTSGDRLKRIEIQKKDILRRGRFPSNPLPEYKGSDNSSSYYNYLCDEEEKLRDLTSEKGIEINSGDWVSLTKSYVRDHGRSWLLNDFKIIQKTVPAKTLYTNADSIHEWGYDP